MINYSQQKSPKCSTCVQSQKTTEWYVRFEGRPFNITVIQVYAPTPNAEDDEIEWFQEDMNHLLKKMSFSSSVIEVQK